MGYAPGSDSQSLLNHHLVVRHFPSTRIAWKIVTCLPGSVSNFNRFPFGVIYQVKSGSERNIEVADLGRRPDYWLGRE